MALGPLNLFDVKRGQEIGQNLAVSNPIGILAKNVMERYSKLSDTATEQTVKSHAELAATKSVFDTAGSSMSGFRPSKYQIGNVTYENPEQELDQARELAGAKNEAEVEPDIRNAMTAIADIERILRVQPDPSNPGKRVIGNRNALSRSGVPGAFLSQDNPDERNLRAAQERLTYSLAKLNTGRQGLEQSTPLMQQQYNLGYTDPDDVLFNRLDSAKKTIQGYQTSSAQTYLAPEQQQQAVQKIRVRNKLSGQTGTISADYFDPSKYEKL